MESIFHMHAGQSTDATKSASDECQPVGAVAAVEVCPVRAAAETAAAGTAGERPAPDCTVPPAAPAAASSTAAGSILLRKFSLAELKPGTHPMSKVGMVGDPGGNEWARLVLKLYLAMWEQTLLANNPHVSHCPLTTRLRH